MEYDEAMKKYFRLYINVETLLPNTTHYRHPDDSFVISKIKYEWIHIWDNYKFQSIKVGSYLVELRGNTVGSGAIRNLGKQLFLKMAAESVRPVNQQFNSNGMSYAQKAMMLCEI